MKETNYFSHMHRFISNPMRRDTIPKHNEATFVVSDSHDLSGRSTLFYNLDNSKKSSSLSASKINVKNELENLMKRRNKIDPLSSISVRPELCQGLAGMPYITPKSSSITTPIEVSRKEAARRSGDNPTASIETKYWKIPLAKHDRYDAAIEAYRRRHTACKFERKATGATNERNRSNQIQAKHEINDKKSTRNSALTSSTFLHQANQRRAEIIEMQKRKSRNRSLSRATSESSSSESVKMQPGCLDTRTLARQNKLARHVCNDNKSEKITEHFHLISPQVQDEADSAMLRQQQKYHAVGRSIKSPKARNISLPPSAASKLMATNKKALGSFDRATSHKQSSEKNSSIHSRNFTNIGVGKQLSRADRRKARAREGRHRMVS